MPTDSKPDPQQTTEAKPPIIDRMEDCGDGRHVGWWMENHLGPEALLIEVTPHSVIISCCEGERAHRRITFVTSRDKAVGIVLALGKALGVEIDSEH